RGAPCAHLNFRKRALVVADRNRIFACPTTSLRGEHTFTGTEKQSCQSCASRDHAQNADPLGAGDSNRTGEQFARIARRLADNCRTLERASDCGENQKLFYTGSPLSFAKVDATKSRTVERD